MPVYQLMPEVPFFPPNDEAEDDGLLAIGGDLNKERLLEAYRNGIFPWYEIGQPILWWTPDPRMILVPEEMKISRSLKKVIKKEHFEIRFDTAFQQVIKACADVRIDQGEGTWIIPEMQKVLASCIDVEIDLVSIKATTTENLSFVGREEGVSAYAVVLIEKN